MTGQDWFKYCCKHQAYFFKYPASSGIAPCVGTAETVQTPTLDTALLSSSRAGADLGPMSVLNHL